MLFFCIAFAVLLLRESTVIGAGLREGMILCVEIVIPSLFPFMVFTTFLALSGWGQRLSGILAPLLRLVFRLPAQAGAAMLMSFIGGYPVGARMIARLMEENKLSPSDGERMLTFCVNAGPSFVLTAAGAGMFHNKRIGLLLLLSHVLASVTVGMIGAVGKAVPLSVSEPESSVKSSAVNSLIRSVSDSALGMLSLCAFVILFSGILTVCRSLGPVTALLEVTKGCSEASLLGGVRGELLAAFLLSFGGLSVIFQAASGYSSYGQTLHFGRFFFWRMVSGAISALWYGMLRYLFADSVERAAAVYGWLPTGSVPVMEHTNITFPLTVCLLAVCAIAALTLEDALDV